MEIRPFRGWRYRAEPGGDVSAYIAPPYDILTAEDKRRLLAVSERNVVAVDLPHVPPTERGPDQAYAAAAETLDRWKSSGVLVQEDRPAIYAYQQAFAWCGRSYSRRAILCGVRATARSGNAIPHERVFPGPVADRLRLMQLTRMELSPVLGFYDDSGGRATELLAGQMARPPDAWGTLRGVQERLWVIDDPGVIAAAASALRDASVFIADGHHRYATALRYRDELRLAGELPASHEAESILFALVARDDPGLLILPTHRVISGLRDGFTVAALAAAAPEFSWRRLEARETDLADSERFLSRFGPGAMAMIDGARDEVWIAALQDREAMRRLAPDKPDAWQDLPAAILHGLIVDRALRAWMPEPPRIDYTPDALEVYRACRGGQAQLGVCLRAVTIQAVESVARSGAVMPHKSTYFHPKPVAGMVFKPL